jgi:hypothetical protein
MKTNNLNELSLRSKFALGITILENAFVNTRTDHPLIQKIIDKAWEFTSNEDLNTWEDEIKEVMPWVILDPYINNFKEYYFISAEEENVIKHIYRKLPNWIIEIFDDVIFIAINNLYSDIHFNNEKNLALLEEIIKKAHQNKVTVPDIKPFLKSSKNENNGWGNNHTRSFYLNQG